MAFWQQISLTHYTQDRLTDTLTVGSYRVTEHYTVTFLVTDTLEVKHPTDKTWYAAQIGIRARDSYTGDITMC